MTILRLFGSGIRTFHVGMLDEIRAARREDDPGIAAFLLGVVLFVDVAVVFLIGVAVVGIGQGFLAVSWMAKLVLVAFAMVANSVVKALWGLTTPVKDREREAP